MPDIKLDVERDFCDRLGALIDENANLPYIRRNFLRDHGGPCRSDVPWTIVIEIETNGGRARFHGRHCILAVGYAADLDNHDNSARRVAAGSPGFFTGSPTHKPP